MSNKRQLKKWVIQAIISIILFSGLYLYTACPLPFSEPVNNFCKYALSHNTDFKWIFDNTVSTMSTLADMMLNDNTNEVFNPNSSLPSASPAVSEE